MRQPRTPMTEGSIPRHLIRYAIPSILGNLFQVTYTTVDSVIVGKYVGGERASGWSTHGGDICGSCCVK